MDAIKRIEIDITEASAISVAIGGMLKGLERGIPMYFTHGDRYQARDYLRGLLLKYNGLHDGLTTAPESNDNPNRAAIKGPYEPGR